jgi:hypothetical protein
MQASNQWMSRPNDERFTSLTDMLTHFNDKRDHSRETVVSSRRIEVVPSEDNKGLMVVGDKDLNHTPTHWSFGQLAQLAEAPGGYLRTIPAPIAADCINYGIRYKRGIEDVGLLMHNDNDTAELQAATGPRYGRVWNADVVGAMVKQFGNGVNGDWRVPGEFGIALKEVTKANTTLFASDRDMFVFLADEVNRVEIPNRRDGKPGTLARGFFAWNSEVAQSTLGLGTFLFDHVCQNRIVWLSQDYAEIRIRHTASAPDKWLQEVAPALLAYKESSTKSIVEGVKAAQAAKVDDVDEFLAARFGKRMVPLLKMTHDAEENRPITSLFDVTTAATAYARGIQHQDARVAIERIAGDVMKLAA